MNQFCHQKLNIPIPPIVDQSVLDEMVDRKFNYPKNKDPETKKHQICCFGFTDVKNILNPELINVFEQIRVRPKVLCMFGLQNYPNYRTAVHSDIYHKIDGGWNFWPASLNYEITVSDVDWYFYDPKNNPPETYDSYSKERLLQEYDQSLISGARYGNPGEFDQTVIDSLGFELIEKYSVEADTYYLNKVSIPHSIDSRCKSSDSRISIQIKFNTQDIPTWESALKVFDSFKS